MIFDLFKKSATIHDSKGLLDYLATGGQSLSGVSVNAKTAMKFAPVFACVRVLAESVGQLPFHLYEQREGSKTKAIDHRLYSLLHDAPNSYQTSQEWREMMVAHLALRGNHYSYINRVRDEVRELLPLNPDSVKPKQDADYNVVYEVRFADGTKDVLDAKDVLHVRLMSYDGLEGLSPITQARESIGLGMATEKFGSLLFKNGAKPGGILSTEQGLKQDQIDLIRSSWEATHSGNDNAHKAAILQGGLKWTAIGMTSDDAQFLETRKYQRSEIAGIFRVPPHMIGDLEKATFSNIEQQSLEFVTNTLMPWLTRIEQRVNMQLLQPKERGRYYAKLNQTALLRGDMKSRGEFYTKLQQVGALSPNEIRELEDMNPRVGGDIYLTPLNMAINGKPIGDAENAD